jgi:uncharacterized protein YcsI (UPF0317 family)
MRVITSAAELRATARHGEWRGTTGGHCPAYQQANLVILPKEAAVEFAAFCTRNPTPCPLLEITPPGDPEPARSAPGADLRTDLPGYRIYRKGELAEQRGDIRDLWRDDLVAFLLGCSLTFEHALIEARVPVRNVECGTMVPMFVSNLACVPAGRFHGPMVDHASHRQRAGPTGPRAVGTLPGPVTGSLRWRAICRTPLAHLSSIDGFRLHLALRRHASRPSAYKGDFA